MAVPPLSNVWCVEFQSGADWYSPANAGQFEQVFAPYQCGRTWLVVHRDDWAAVLAAAGSSTGATQFTEAEVVALKYQAANPSPFNLTLEDGALIASAILGVWGIAVCWRELAAFVRGGNSEEDLK